MTFTLKQRLLLFEIEADPIWKEHRALLEGKMFIGPEGRETPHPDYLAVKRYWDRAVQGMRRTGMERKLKSFGLPEYLLHQAIVSLDGLKKSESLFYDLGSSVSQVLWHTFAEEDYRKIHLVWKDLRIHPGVVDDLVPTGLSEFVIEAVTPYALMLYINKAREEDQRG